MPASFTPEVWAVILAAFLGAIVSQFLSFYRKQRQGIEELKGTLYLIAQLDEQDIDAKVDRPDSILWYLREKLYGEYKSNIIYVGDNHRDVLEVVRLFPSKEMENRTQYTSPRKLQQSASKAFDTLDQLRWYNLLWQSLLAFSGFSQIEYGDAIEDYLEVNNDTSGADELDLMDSSKIQFEIPPRLIIILATISVLSVIITVGILYLNPGLPEVIKIGLLAGVVGLVTGIVLTTMVYHFQD